MSTSSLSGKGLLLKADPIASAFRDEVQNTLTACPRAPKLVGILSTSSGPSRTYAEFTKKQCESFGFQFVLKETGAAISNEGEGLGEGEGVEEAIMEANEDDSVDGIMVYFPIFGPQQDHYLQQIVSPYKDVEGLHVKFHYNLYHNIRFISPSSLSSPTSGSAGLTGAEAENDVPPPGMVKSILPCTPLAIVKCIEYAGVYNKILPYGDRAYGKTVVVVNRSEVVGRPLAALLANDGARVFSVDIDSIQEYTKRPSESDSSSSRKYHPRHIVRPPPATLNTLEACLAVADVVVSAVPNANYKIPTAWLKDGCVCVNVAAEKNFEKDVRDKASLYIPAVGKVTILMLLRNLLRLQQYKSQTATPLSDPEEESVQPLPPQ
ncbi:NAD(P)-binding protein [Gymnopus androsaceus JB14]|uniref:NAD(P)-binding protein n=1 Tax=Gymnopus androsaceus JB14 TaxID=1447944 RepID=A0A6A4IN11_9AGAR|nr:NAD(P)-binding protein [Gymnopus androsaceus JB14]